LDKSFIRVGNAQILGERSEQQDYFATMTHAETRIAVVADGIGGYAGGAYASELVVKAFLNSLRGESELLYTPASLLNALQSASQVLMKQCRNDTNLADMGTTLIAVLCREQQLWWISVGDSPLYLSRNRKLQRLNANHSQSELLLAAVERGEMSLEQAQADPDFYLISSALTAEPPTLIDCPQTALEIEQTDRILLASDGIHTLSDMEIGQILASIDDPQIMAETLVKRVSEKSNNGQDNCTVVVLMNNMREH